MLPSGWRESLNAPAVLADPAAEADRLIVWLAEPAGDGVQDWVRVATVVGAEIDHGNGLFATPATAIRARQRQTGFVGRLFGRLRGAPAGRTWVLPGGGSADQVGDKESDVIVVWTEGPDEVLNEERLRAQWPGARTIRPLGPRLFVVWGVPRRRAQTMPEPVPGEAEGCPDVLAPLLLAAARRSGDPAQLVAALTDMGLVQLDRQDAATAVTLLEEAAALVPRLGDPGRECDVLGNLGVALLAAGQTARARGLFERELHLAREARDPFAEKVALENLGHAHARQGEPDRALAAWAQAVAMAGTIGDRKQEGRLLWTLAIQHAAMGQRDQAIASASATLQLYRQIGNPEAAWYDDHLQRYMNEDAPLLSLSATGAAASVAGTGARAASAGPRPAQGPEQSERGPGLLRMALSATRSMAQFLGSALRTVPAATYHERVQTCARCEHHTGLRCRVCGCFTSAKARMLHEACPIGKWPVHVEIRKP